MQEQRRWLQLRLNKCRIPSRGDLPAEAGDDAKRCLGALYEARIAALETQINQPRTATAALPGAAPAKTEPAAVPIEPQAGRAKGRRVQGKTVAQPVAQIKLAIATVGDA